jgi:hypothetical protein
MRRVLRTSRRRGLDTPLLAVSDSGAPIVNGVDKNFIARALTEMRWPARRALGRSSARAAAQNASMQRAFGGMRGQTESS